jgi:hypothetical protein
MRGDDAGDALSSEQLAATKAGFRLLRSLNACLQHKAAS